MGQSRPRPNNPSSVPKDSKIVTLKVGPNESGERLDRFVASAAPGLSRTQAKRLIQDGLVQVKGCSEPSPSLKVREGQTVTISIPPPKSLDLLPEEVQFEILFEDSHLIVINKPPGLVVHPGAGHTEKTLVHGLLHHCKDLSGVGGALRPGIVHRLDKDTSGVMVIAKDDSTHLGLANQFKEGAIRKKYLALVRGRLKDRTGVIDLPIGRHPVHRKKMAPLPPDKGRRALSTYRVVKELEVASLVEIQLHTGRTHQIRVHMSAIGHPLLGDPLYGGPRKLKNRDKEVAIPRQMLHSLSLRFVHPVLNKEMTFQAALPEDMKKILKALGPLPDLAPGYNR